jgi:antitoxin (DNA-binding transcriptional repressor) of toxin-antitoxin stability system
MKKLVISINEAARNFSECVNRVHYQNVTFVLLKNGSPVARLVPDQEKVFTAGDLAEALSKIHLTADEARGWRRDLRRGHKMLKPRPIDGDDCRRQRPR